MVHNQMVMNYLSLILFSSISIKKLKRQKKKMLKSSTYFCKIISMIESILKNGSEYLCIIKDIN